jgi:signal transduction histidine kinase
VLVCSSGLSDDVVEVQISIRTCATQVVTKRYGWGVMDECVLPSDVDRATKRAGHCRLAAETSRRESGGVHGSLRSPDLPSAPPCGRLTVPRSTGGRNPASPASGPLLPAGRHRPGSAVAARFSTVRKMHVIVVMIAVGLVAAIASGVLAPQLHPGDQWQAEDVTTETGLSIIGLLAYFLVFGWLGRRTRLNDLMLACAIAVLALSSLFLATVPAVTGWAPDELTVWGVPVAGSFGALLFVLAAWLPNRQLRLSGPPLVAGAGGVIAALLLTMAMIPALARTLPHHVVASLTPGSSTRPDMFMDPAQLGLQLATAALYGAAAVGFVRRFQRGRDEFTGWLAVAAVLAAASEVNYLLSAMHPQFLYGGDALRCAFYVVLLLGSTREIWSYWNARPWSSVLEERQRIACELHDGVAQELAYLAHNLESLGGEADEDGLDRLRRGVERARLESRRVISAAAAPSGQPLEVALAEAATEVAERYHVELDLDLTSDIRLPAPRREAFVRIACEAVANAARHSGADRVNLGLERDGSGVRLWVSDKGHGFDPGDPGGGFGLTSMRERAHSVGAELVVSSAPGYGSQVEVAL